MNPSAGPLRLLPTRLDERGAGVAVVDGMEVHVAGLLPGEEAEVAIEHLSPHVGPGGARRAWARTLALSRPSPERVPPACPAHGDCGACLLQHLSYPAQLRWKREQVTAALAEVAAPEWPEPEPCLPSPRLLGYRNQGKYIYGLGPGDRRPVLGAYAPRSHRLVDLQGCQLVEPVIDQTAGRLRDRLAEAGLPPFDEQRRTGLLRGCVLRSNRRGEVLVALVTGRRGFTEGPALARALRAEQPQVVGVVWNINETTGNAIFGDEDVLLDGQPFLTEELAGIEVQVAARAFLQLNREVAALIYDQVAQAAAGLGRCERAVELYAGLGAMSFAVAPLAREVVAVEENPQAVAAGAQAAAAAGLDGLRFHAADAARGLLGIERADLVIVNPPRAGLAAEVASGVAALAPRLCAYLSCNPVTLARDLRRLAAGGLRPARITPFDMLPHTAHVEALVLLERAR
jgi:23S rRNA (uracil1939-C5)-methyltransferase